MREDSRFRLVTIALVLGIVFPVSYLMSQVVDPEKKEIRDEKDDAGSGSQGGTAWVAEAPGTKADRAGHASRPMP